MKGILKFLSWKPSYSFWRKKDDLGHRLLANHIRITTIVRGC
ncbi:hypothetical protein SAMN05660297_03229 [Natronincola peptidivorans]|uniref:Uncharacterized protein n=1 Tax=Natronincola peptidivorans TaxID=426128 RepID=A0A1I0GKN2_9FIRM|nr:hypothetical protein [Natronincola peptidivorans]SET70738.1 hypothetical protein SAMN05660297_03229 [Natronincola peptidivorans]